MTENDKRLTYKYHSLNRLVEVNYDSGQKVSYIYDSGVAYVSSNGSIATVSSSGVNCISDKINLNQAYMATIYR